ncbi:MAG TPA: glycoside hydrolase family 28 protein [Verrucomicrobiae bacterium]|nr:glycoside hydrolase family 28 protein [Verrucomicrobiae bacterium]
MSFAEVSMGLSARVDYRFAMAFRFGWIAFTTALAFIPQLSFAQIPTAAANAGWNLVPEILKRIVPPTFPKREFSIHDFGAIEGGQTNCSAAFKSAIDACVSSGGGRVVVPAGKFLTGPIHLQSNVELHLSEGAEIIFSDRFEDYLPPVFVRVGGIELYNYSPLIYARDCTNIAVTGPGKLNGNAKAWWEWRRKEGAHFFEMAARGVPVDQRVFGTPEAAIRPSFLSFVSCTNILLEDFTIGSGPNWTIHPIYCLNTTIRGVNVDTDGPNNDGIDPDSCRDLLIEDCTFSTGDDCVVLKSGYNEDGWRVGRPTENVIMRRCFSKRGHGGLVIGSEMSGDVRNVFMYDCEFDGTDRAIRIKSRRGRGGVVENIWARNLKVKNMQREVVILNMDYSADQKKAVNEKPPVFRNMVISDVTGDGAPMAMLISGLSDSPVENIRFENMTIHSTRGVVAKDVRGIVFDGVQVTPEKGPVFAFTNAAEVMIRRTKAPKETDVFLSVAGKNSERIRIEASDLSGAKQPFTTAPEVKENAVSVK